MAEPMDDRYATFREHAELRERTATLEATMLQIGPTMSRIETMVATKINSPQQQDHLLLAMHDMAKSMREASGGGMGVGTTILIGLALFGVGLGCFLVGKVFF